RSLRQGDQARRDRRTRSVRRGERRQSERPSTPDPDTVGMCSVHRAFEGAHVLRRSSAARQAEATPCTPLTVSWEWSLIPYREICAHRGGEPPRYDLIRMSMVSGGDPAVWMRRWRRSGRMLMRDSAAALAAENRREGAPVFRR